MRRPLRLGLAVLVTGLVLSPGVMAQEPADTADRPFVTGGVYDRPYLGRLLGRTAIGGYAEAHARYARADGVREEAGFVAKRFNLFTATRVSDFVRIGAELEIEEGGEELTLEFAAIDLIIHPAFTLRGGVILSPLGRFNLAHDSPLNPFTDRPLVSTELLGVALSEPGFGALGTIGLRGQARVTYEIYATNGFDDGLVFESPEGTRLAAGRGNFEDQNSSPAVVGRLAWSPRAGHELGVSAHHGAWNVFALDGEAVDERRDLTVAVADVETEAAGFQITAEAALVRLDIPASLESIAASRQAGGYVDIEYPFLRGVPATMPNSTISAKVRFDAVDFDQDRAGDGVARVSAGFNFRPTPDTVLKLEYTRGRERDRFNSPAETAALLFSIATYF
ncbi:MAG TPA: hypothetical protein VMM12_08695 [Longimicrobiales bacterium]|nr:hypothetical protein [Longimicrobiales bacterium]